MKRMLLFFTAFYLSMQNTAWACETFELIPEAKICGSCQKRPRIDEKQPPIELREPRRLFNERNYQKAADLYKEILSTSVDPSLKGQAQFEWGLSLWRQDYYHEAMYQWEDLAKSFPSHPSRANALYLVGFTYAGLGKYEKSIRTFEQLIQEATQNNYAEDASYELIRVSYRGPMGKGNLKEAMSAFRKTAKLFPGKPCTGQAAAELLYANDAAAIEGNPGLSDSELDELRQHDPHGKYAAQLKKIKIDRLAL